VGLVQVLLGILSPFYSIIEDKQVKKAKAQGHRG